MVAVTDVLVKPVQTEKTSAQTGKYTFVVHDDATKNDVKSAVKEFYNIETEKVNIISLPEKSRGAGRGRSIRRRSETKKAIVTTKKGAIIDFNSFK